MKQYCGEYSLNLNEPMGGTAGHAEHFFFMTWPKTKWGRKAFQDSDRASTSHYSEVERYSGGYTWRNFNQVNSASRPIELEGLKICAYPEGILCDKIPTKGVLRFGKSTKGKFQKNHIPKSLSSNRQLFICTHGRHDQCCAKFGQQLFDTLRKSIPDTDHTVEIWESSHLGGHRFAPTVLVMPGCKMYGKVKPSLINALLYGEFPSKLHREMSFTRLAYKLSN